MTYNFNDLTRYFKYNMSSGVMMATVERKVMDAMEDIKGSNFNTFIKFLGVGIMVFMIILGAVILLRTLPGGGGGPAPIIPVIQGSIALLWRRKHGNMQKVQ
jgi:hypothetical protein